MSHMFKTSLLCCIALRVFIVGSEARAAVVKYPSLITWQSAVGQVDAFLPFGDYPTNTLINSQYQRLGVIFGGTSYAITNYYGQSYVLNNKQFVSDNPGQIQMDFLDPLSAIAMDLKGSQSGEATLNLFSTGTLLWRGSIPPADFDAHVWSFFGFGTTDGTTITRAVIDPGTGDLTGTFLDTLRISQVPLPPAVLLLGSALAYLGFGTLARRNKRKDRRLGR